MKYHSGEKFLPGLRKREDLRHRWVALFVRRHTSGPLNSSPFATKVNLCTFPSFRIYLIRHYSRKWTQRQRKLSAHAGRRACFPSQPGEVLWIKFFHSAYARIQLSTFFRATVLFMLFLGILSPYKCLFNQMATYETYTKRVAEHNDNINSLP